MTRCHGSSCVCLRPSEILNPGDEVKVKILEIDSERRRLSLSVKRVEGQELPQRDMTAEPAVPAEVPEPPAAEAPDEEPAAEEPPAENG